MQLALTVVGSLLIVVTALSAIRADHWWVRMGDFPRAQMTALAALVFAAYVAVREPRGAWELAFLAALAAAVLYQLGMMLPYTRLWRTQVKRAHDPAPERRFTLMICNVLQSNRRHERLLELVRQADPDIIVAVETDGWWQERLDVLEKERPRTLKCPLDNTYGMLLYSRLELVEPRIRFLVEDDIPSFHTRVRLPFGKEIELHCVHPRPPAPGENTRSTERDAELLMVGRAVKDSPLPVVVAGDLNDVAWSHTTRLFQKVSGLLDPRVGRGFFNTFHASYPLVRWPLDHVFHSDKFRLISLHRLPRFGSDHFPVCISLSYERDAEDEQDEPQADAGDQQRAVRKIEKAREEPRKEREGEG